MDTKALAIGNTISPSAQNSPTSWLTTGSTIGNARVPRCSPGAWAKCDGMMVHS
jgi:hypothetical protein